MSSKSLHSGKSGFVHSFYYRSVPIYFEWLAYLSWFKYGNEALLVNQWENVTNIECPPGNTTCPKDGRVVLEFYNFKPVRNNMKYKKI